MKGHISLPDSNRGAIPVISQVEIYRDPEDTQEIMASTENGVVSFGISDVTVSRKKGGNAPITVEKHASFLEVHNQRSTNPVEIIIGGKKYELEQGHAKRVTRDATISIGYQTELRLEITREAKKEVNVDGDVSGDVVMGHNIDKSTAVNDSVINRSDIGSDGSAEVTDSVVNRSRVGNNTSEELDDKESRRTSVQDRDTDTKDFCETHQLAFAGGKCPECSKEDSKQVVQEQQDKTERKFCIFCGDEIPAVANVCPECGESLPQN